MKRPLVKCCPNLFKFYILFSTRTETYFKVIQNLSDNLSFQDCYLTVIKAVSRKFTLIRGVNFKISPDFGPHICKQTGQKSKSNCKHINILRNFNLIYNKITRNHVIYSMILHDFA